MAVPSYKSPGLEAMADDMAEAMFGRKRTDSIKADICVGCGKAANDFSDELSRKEYTISGFCQQCQDGIFYD